MERYEAAFFIGQGPLRKADFAKNRYWESKTIFCTKNPFFAVLETFIFSNACGIRINVGTKEKNCGREYGPLAKLIRNRKQVGCFKVS